jgi:hypothetical protein
VRDRDTAALPQSQHPCQHLRECGISQTGVSACPVRACVSVCVSVCVWLLRVSQVYPVFVVGCLFFLRLTNAAVFCSWWSLFAFSPQRLP